MVILMINKTLYFKELKRNFPLFIIFAFLLLLYGGIVSSLFNPNPDMTNWMELVTEQFPEMMEFIGFNVNNLNDYQSFVAGYLYGMLMIAFGLILVILLVNKLIFNYISNGSFVFLLSSPNSRNKVLGTQIFVVLTYLFSFVLTIFLILALSGSLNFPQHVDWLKLLYLNFSFFLLLLFISSLTTFASSLFEGKVAFSLNIGLNVSFFIFKLISNLGNNYKFFKYLTPYSLFNIEKALNFEFGSVINNIILLLLTVTLYTITFISFKKKDLSL